MSAHAFFSPSSAHRWVNCPGSMAFGRNQESGDSSSFADDGTASHTWAADCLTNNWDADSLLGAKIVLNGREYVMDEDRAGYVQQYLDDVRLRALGGFLLVEHKLDLSPYFGEDQFGTSDAVIMRDGAGQYSDDSGEHLTHDLLIIEDLKYGVGEKVYAKDNEQGMSYALGALEDARLTGRDPSHVLIVISQPRLNHLDEWLAPVARLMEFAEKAKLAIDAAGRTMVMPVGSDGIPTDSDFMLYLNPGKKTCRWCRVTATCPKLAKIVQEEVRSDFDAMLVDAPPAPRDSHQLTRAMNAVPLIELWCGAVKSEVNRRVREGEEVIGPDGKPYKIVEGDLGDRKWIDETAAEAALLGQLPPEKAYAPRKILTAAKAAQVLDKKATKQLWKDVFVPLIKRAPGQPKLALGSDPRPPYSGAASTADEFATE